MQYAQHAHHQHQNLAAAAHATTGSEQKACCAGTAGRTVAAPSASLRRLATAATLHCLTGCAIGELAGLGLGVSLGLAPASTMTLATVLGFISGFTLGLRPLLGQGLNLAAAFKAIWLGELLSIGTMELVMNLVDYHVGGMRAMSIAAPTFWLGYALALPAGFLAAWPVNFLLLRHHIKQPCH